MCISSDYESLNRFSPNVTFIIFKQLISLDETEKDGDPTLLLQRWTEGRMEGAREDTGQPSETPALSRERERESEGERERERESDVF